MNQLVSILRCMVLSGLLLVLTGPAARAQLYFENKTEVPLRVAYAMNDLYRGWISFGWRRIEPGRRVMLNPTIGTDSYVRYYAETAEGITRSKGGIPMLVHPRDSFAIINRFPGEVKKEFPQYEFREFVQVPFRNEWGTQEYTIAFYGE